MERDNKLEQIFSKKDKFVDLEGKELNPIPLGEPALISYTKADFPDLHKRIQFVEKLINNLGSIEKANSYCRGFAQDFEGSNFVPVNFYNI